MDRLLSQDFTGDLRDLAVDPKLVKVSRIKPHVVSLQVADKEFLLAVHKPKPEKAKLAAKARAARKPKAGPAKGGLGRY